MFVNFLYDSGNERENKPVGQREPARRWIVAESIWSIKSLEGKRITIFNMVDGMVCGMARMTFRALWMKTVNQMAVDMGTKANGEQKNPKATIPEFFQHGSP